MCIIRATLNGGGLPYSIVQYFHQIAYTTDIKVTFETIISIIRSIKNLPCVSIYILFQYFQFDQYINHHFVQSTQLCCTRLAPVYVQLKDYCARLKTLQLTNRTTHIDDFNNLKDFFLRNLEAAKTHMERWTTKVVVKVQLGYILACNDESVLTVASRRYFHIER